MGNSAGSRSIRLPSVEDRKGDTDVLDLSSHPPAPLFTPPRGLVKFGPFPI